MNKLLRILIKPILIIVVVFVLVYLGANYLVPKYIFWSISQSHIKGNVPDNDTFRGYLVRDLNEYFTGVLKNETFVDYQLLRKEPFQSGLAYPKYYAWIVGSDKSGKITTEGFVRLSAQEKEYFVVTDFVSKNEIREDPSSLEGIIPEELIVEVIERST